MTIRTRMWVTHLFSLIIAIGLTLIFALVVAIGFYSYIQKYHSIIPSTALQFNRVNDALAYSTFYDLSENGTLTWSIYANKLMDPTRTSITIYKNGNLFYQYGNNALINGIPKSMSTSITDEVYSTSYKKIFYSRISQIIQNDTYSYLFLIEKPPVEAVGQFNRIIRLMVTILVYLTLAFFGFLSFIQTRSILRYMMNPIIKLSHAADEVAKGHLDIHVQYDKNDEFKPIVERFNAMAKTLKINQSLRDEAERNRQELIAGISHDIRTPLTSIQAYVEGLLEPVATSPEAQQKYLQIIHKKANDLDQTLSQLFLFSKLDLGEESLHLEKINLHQLLREYIQDNKEWYKSKGLTISLRINSPATIMGDQLFLIRSLENILTNTVKYKVKSKAYSRITLTTIGTSAILTITDDGPGISSENATHIFDVFYRTDKARQNVAEGSGLGLAITAKYIELLGGSIKARPVTPNGLQMTIMLPLYKEEL